MPFNFTADANGNVGAVTSIRSGNDFVVPILDIIGMQYLLTNTNLGVSATYTGATIDRLAGGMIESRIRLYSESNAASATAGLLVEESHDGTTWVTVGTGTTTVANTMADTGWRVLTRRYWRARYVNGTTAQTRFVLYETRDTVIDDVTVSGTATVAGTVTAAQTAAASLRMAMGVATTGGATPLQLTNVTTTQTIKATAGTLYQLQTYNPGAALVYVQVHNATAPTLGTTVPLQSYAVPAGTVQDVPLPGAGLNFATAITVAATTTARGATLAATGVEISAAFA